MKHTPGPWITRAGETNDKYGRTLGVVVDESNNDGVSKAVCYVSPESDITDEDVANAKLIAAAPELLEALKELQAYANKTIGNHGPIAMWSKVREAIAKTEGTNNG